MRKFPYTKQASFAKMKSMKKRLVLIGLTIYCCGLLAGCSNNLEQENALKQQGIELMDEGDYLGAIDTFNEALDLSIGKVTALELDINYYKAAAQYDEGLYDDAISTYSALIKYDGDNYKPLFLRGCLYANAGDMTQAVKDFDAAIALDEKNYLLYIQIDQNLETIGQSDQGLVYLNKALAVTDKSADAYYYKGRIYYMLGQYDLALENLQTAVDKNVVEAKLYLAKLYQAEEEWDLAQSLLEDYAFSDDVNSDALATLGDIEMASGNYESALSYYQAGLSLESIDNLPQLYKGQVAALENLHRFDEAKQVLTQYVESYPQDQEAARELIFLKNR